MSTTKINPYLKNEYQPLKLQDELENWIELPILKGAIPVELAGYFLRNSSNPQFHPNNKYHWFDGDGYIQGCKFSRGKVFFKGRFIRTEKFLEEKAKGKSLYGGLRGPINKNNTFQSLQRLWHFVIGGKNPFPNTSNTDLVYHHQTLFSLWMLGGTPYKIDLETLETQGQYKFESPANNYKGLTHGAAAHPKVCPKDDTLFVMDFAPSWNRFKTPSLYLSSISKDATTIHTKKIKISGRRLLHDIAVTENYVLLLDFPATMTPWGLQYQQEQPARFGVVPCDFQKIKHPKTKQLEEVLWFDDPSGCYIIHVVNAYEEGNKIVLLALRKPYLNINKRATDKEGDVFAGHLHQWEFDLETGEISQQTGQSLRAHFPHGSEFPSINSHFEGLKNRYSYLPHVSATPLFNFDAFSKYDHANNSYSTYTFPKGMYTGELRFVPRQAAQKEDEGWLVTYVNDTRQGKNEAFLYVFDAQHIEEGPIAIAQIPVCLPIGFHTTWVNQQEVEG